MNSSLDERVDKLLLTFENNSIFSGCAIALSTLDTGKFKRRTCYRGWVDERSTQLPVNKCTFFDLASLTKPLVTILCLLCLVKDKKVRWEDNLDQLLPLFVPDDKKKIRLIDLVGHTSGLPAHRPYFQKVDPATGNIDLLAVISLILNEELKDTPGRSYLYSDLDYLLLGYIIEHLSGTELGKYWQDKIAGPLKIEDEFYLMGDKGKKNKEASFAVTGKCPWTGAILAGLVHDDNCRALGRVSGHAGLFGTLNGVLELCESLLLNYEGEKEHPSYAREDLLYLVKERNKDQWACGFDVPTGDKPSCGKYFSKKTIGHLGFTGTSFWIDLTDGKIVVFLTNRVIYGNDNEIIKELRPKLHDTLLSP